MICNFKNYFTNCTCNEKDFKNRIDSRSM